MHFTPLSFGIGTTRRAPVAVLCGVLVAACDTGSTVSPTTTSTATAFPTPASAAVAPGGLGNLIVTTVDVHQKLIGGATFKILAPNLVVGFVSDNDAMDRDSTLGKIHLKALPIGSYTVCEIVPPVGYALPDWDCHPTTVYSGQTTGAEAFVSQRLPYVQSGFVDRFGKYVGGGSMVVKDSTGKPVVLVADNGPLDVSKIDGYFSVLLPAPGKYSMCAATAPAGWAVSPRINPCLDVNAKNGTIHYLESIRLNPAPSIVWDVRDPFAAPIGPSSFTISIPRQFISIPVVDNGLNDLDPKLGWFLVKLPKAGAYTLCQTQAPANRYLAKPPCRTVDVTSGGSVDAGWFVNAEKQVYSP